MMLLQTRELVPSAAGVPVGDAMPRTTVTLHRASRDPGGRKRALRTMHVCARTSSLAEGHGEEREAIDELVALVLIGEAECELLRDAAASFQSDDDERLRATFLGRARLHIDVAHRRESEHLRPARALDDERLFGSV